MLTSAKCYNTPFTNTHYNWSFLQFSLSCLRGFSTSCIWRGGHHTSPLLIILWIQWTWASSINARHNWYSWMTILSQEQCHKVVHLQNKSVDQPTWTSPTKRWKCSELHAKLGDSVILTRPDALHLGQGKGLSMRYLTPWHRRHKVHFNPNSDENPPCGMKSSKARHRWWKQGQPQRGTWVETKAATARDGGRTFPRRNRSPTRLRGDFQARRSSWGIQVVWQSSSTVQLPTVNNTALVHHKA